MVGEERYKEEEEFDGELSGSHAVFFSCGQNK
jgi:hypothetical protein